jgi:hypothetical protein
MPNLVISDWYELVEGDELMQGDIIEGCPIFRPPKDLPWPLPEGDVNADFDAGNVDVVILSQSCDIVKDQKGDVWQVILCPVWSLSKAADANPYLKGTGGKNACLRGNMPGYHMIAASEHLEWQREIRIVSFREIYGLPLEFVRKIASSQPKRARLRSPCREHLAQAFARYFMRVGLPSDIPPFK